MNQIVYLVAVGELLRQESDRQIETAVTNRSGLARKKVLRRRRTSDRGGSKRPSVTDHTHGASSKQVTPVKRAAVRGVSLIQLVSLPLLGVKSIAISMSVCPPAYLKKHVQISHNFLNMLLVAVAQSSLNVKLVFLKVKRHYLDSVSLTVSPTVSNELAETYFVT